MLPFSLFKFNLGAYWLLRSSKSNVAHKIGETAVPSELFCFIVATKSEVNAMKFGGTKLILMVIRTKEHTADCNGINQVRVTNISLSSPSKFTSLQDHCLQINQEFVLTKTCEN